MQQAQQAPLALTAHKVCKASKGSRVFKAKLVQQAQLAPLALTAHKAYKVTSDQLDRKVFREFKAKLARQARRDRRVMLARWVCKVSKESKVRPAKLAQQAQLVLRVM